MQIFNQKRLIFQRITTNKIKFRAAKFYALVLKWEKTLRDVQNLAEKKYDKAMKNFVTLVKNVPYLVRDFVIERYLYACTFVYTIARLELRCDEMPQNKMCQEYLQRQIGRLYSLFTKSNEKLALYLRKSNKIAKKQMNIPLYINYSHDYFKMNEKRDQDLRLIRNIEMIGWPDLTFPKEKELDALYYEEQELQNKTKLQRQSLKLLFKNTQEQSSTDGSYEEEEDSESLDKQIRRCYKLD